MSLLDILNPIKVIADVAQQIIGKFVADPTEKLALQKSLLDAQTELTNKALDLQSQVVTAQAAIITAEATSSSWLEKDWRPLLMLFFGSCVGWVIVGGGTNIHGIAIPADYVNWVLRIVAIGVGGYVSEPIVNAIKGNGHNGNGH